MVTPGVGCFTKSSVADSSPSPIKSNDCEALDYYMGYSNQVHLLVRETAVRENSIRIAGFVSSPGHALVLQIPFKPLNNVPSAVSSGFGEI